VNTLNIVALVWLMMCWLLWLAPFILHRAKQAPQQAVTVAPRARWGLGLQIIAFAIAWIRTPDAKPTILLIASMILAPASAALAWLSVRHLGKQWRIDAGLNEDHNLVRSGPYAVVRHPIYSSLLGMLLATGFVMLWWPGLIVACVIFLVGLEIRIRAEDDLLAGRFGETFRQYKGSVRAYLPFMR
jgi:protein-S-isoprenylcysteine O-methyltransferase Ste14